MSETETLVAGASAAPPSTQENYVKWVEAVVLLMVFMALVVGLVTAREIISKWLGGKGDRK